MPGFVLEDTTREEAEQHGVKIFIPNIMAKIPKSNPRKSQLRTNSISVFLNDSTCKAVVSRVLKEKNYLVAYKKDDYSFEKLLVNDMIKKGTKVQVDFVLQKLSKIVFS